MEWRVTIELGGADGTKQTHEVARGGGSDPHSILDPLGLTLDDGKTLLASVQRHLVQARVAEYSALRRRCSHCRGLRPKGMLHCTCPVYILVPDSYSLDPMEFGLEATDFADTLRSN